MQKVTIWSRLDPVKGIFKHNHIEDGHVTGAVPQPRSEEQEKQWPTEPDNWRKQYGYRHNGQVLSEQDGLLEQFNELLESISFHAEKKHGMSGTVYVYKFTEERLQKMVDNMNAYHEHKWKREE